MKNKMMMLMLGLFIISFVSAQQSEYEIDTQVNVTVICLSDGYCSQLAYCNINIEDPLGEFVVAGANMTNQISFHNYTINATTIGTYHVTGFCRDSGETEQIDFTFRVSYLGKAPPTGFDGRFVLLLCFVSLLILIIYLQRQINFDRWYGSILTKYKNRNFFRTFIASIGFFFMKNPFSVFYMIGLFIVLLMFNITQAYMLTSIYHIMQIFIVLYLFGLWFIILEIFGDIHEFFSKIMEDFKGLGWGIDNG